MKYIMIGLLLLAVGCGDIDITVINKSLQFCKDKGGVKQITTVIGNDFCYCRNGEYINVDLVELKPENY